MLWLVVIVLMLVGLAGTVVPFLPGTPLIFLAVLIYAVATEWTPIGGGGLIVIGLLAALGYLVPHLAVAIGARHGGGSRWAIGGAVIGGIAGIFMGVPGVLLGPLVGAIVGELIHSGNLPASLQTGFTTFIGMVAGAVANVAIAVMMIALFLLWVARG
jgi:uncharacterized protein YqgC (DUF456 family)